MKKSISMLLVLCVLFMMGCIPGSADEAAAEDLTIILQVDNPSMTVNGMEEEIDPGRGTVPVVINDRTLVPVRAIVEKMGGTVEWEESTLTAVLTYGDDEIRLTTGSTTAYLNGEARTLDAAPQVINDRTMLPIRFIAESFNFNVAWDQDEKLITITQASEIAEPSPEPSESPEATTGPEATAAPGSTSAPEPEGSNTLIAYFSCTGNTESLAEKIAEVTGADIYEIVPEEPYTSEDLNYSNDSCRANQEMNDENARPAISGNIENIDEYDTIFLGYPIWWGTMPRIINTFIDTYDLSGMTIIPFCTSGSSGISASVSAIRELCPDSEVTDGFRGTASTTGAQIEDWLIEIGFAVRTEAAA